MERLRIMDFLEGIPDPRRRAGQRHKWPHLLFLSMLSSLCGCDSMRAMADFVSANAAELRACLGLSPHKPLPSLPTLWRCFRDLDTEAFRQAMTAWEREGKGPFFLLHLDGKALEGSLLYPNTPQESFQAVVSLFSSQTGESLSAITFDNKRASEARMARKLFKDTGVKGSLVTMDALHAQKKRRRPSAARAPITSSR